MQALEDIILRLKEDNFQLKQKVDLGEKRTRDNYFKFREIIERLLEKAMKKLGRRRVVNIEIECKTDL